MFRIILSRFRTKRGLSTDCCRQLAAHEVIIRNGAGIVDATLTDTPRCPKGKPVYELAEDRKEDQRSAEEYDKEEVQTCALV